MTLSMYPMSLGSSTVVRSEHLTKDVLIYYVIEDVS
jgi:hypothetical protein